MLYIFGGLPGTGKTTLSRAFAKQQKAIHLRIDTIEQALRETGARVDGPEGYIIAYRIAADHLRMGLAVVADSVNPIEITRAAWREVAKTVGVQFLEIEVICSNPVEHRHRVEMRSTDIPGLTLPTWEEIVGRDYQRWDTEHLVIDTAGQTIEQSIAALHQALV
jgi:predicted kinase